MMAMFLATTIFIDGDGADEARSKDDVGVKNEAGDGDVGEHRVVGVDEYLDERRGADEE